MSWRPTRASYRSLESMQDHGANVAAVAVGFKESEDATRRCTTTGATWRFSRGKAQSRGVSGGGGALHGHREV